MYVQSVFTRKVITGSTVLLVGLLLLLLPACTLPHRAAAWPPATAQRVGVPSDSSSSTLTASPTPTVMPAPDLQAAIADAGPSSSTEAETESQTLVLRVRRALLASKLVVAVDRAGPASVMLASEFDRTGPASVIDAGVEFLRGQRKYGLLQESPDIGKYRYYLNDSALAAYALEQVGETDFARELTQTLQSYDYQGNDFFEVAEVEKEETISWPPYHHKDEEKEKLEEGGDCDNPDDDTATEPFVDCVLLQTHPPDLGHFYDWSSYSNLACMGAVNEYTNPDGPSGPTGPRVRWVSYPLSGGEAPSGRPQRGNDVDGDIGVTDDGL